MAFWHFRQNNSFGTFDRNAIVNENVIIEAECGEHAEARMQAIVDSYSQGGDCPCCGDRWYVSAWDESGNSVELVYGKSILLYENDESTSKAVSLVVQKKKSTLNIDTVVHYLDGSISYGLAPSMW
jgi:hypothetical protein